jgi:hypothetical protein
MKKEVIPIAVLKEESTIDITIAYLAFIIRNLFLNILKISSNIIKNKKLMEFKAYLNGGLSKHVTKL